MTHAHLIGGLSVALAMLAVPPLRAEELPATLGRISYGTNPQTGDAICTGVLVAPDLVMTAAHCVRGSAQTPETIRFDAGWVADKPTVQRRGAEVILVGEGEVEGLAGLTEDVALLVLDAALPPGDFPPVAISVPGGGPFTLIGFDRAAPDAPQRAAQCRPLAGPPGLLALDCPVVSGNSGAPLLERDGSGWRLVAVMVASARGGPVRSWAVLPPVPLQLRIADTMED